MKCRRTMTGTTHADDGKERTTEFMHALANEVDAVNISADKTGVGYMVHAWILETGQEMELASDIAREYDFRAFGETEHAGVNRPPSAGDRARIRFETDA